MKNSLKKSKAVLIVCLLMIIPVLLFFSLKNNYGYILPSILVLLLSLIPFIKIYENKKIRTRELVLVAVMSAIAVIGRIMLFFIPEVKAISAIVIISGMVLGPEVGFIVGTTSGFVSDFFFGQGIWVIWQMFGFGMIGALSGVILKNKRSRIFVCIIGFLLVFVVYGGIVNMQSLLMYTTTINLKSILTIYLPAIPFDVIHGLSTAIFLWFLVNPFYEKLSRIKEKYGMIDFR